MIKVSVIVPVYNVEAYLKKCLDSLVKQTLKEIEIIVVNDGSPDNSQKIIDKYVKKYPNIRSYTKKNGGLSSARNYGIKKAKGEYIAFVDSDDYISPNMYEVMYKKASEFNYDMVVSNLNYIYTNKVVGCNSGIPEDTNDIKKTMISLYPSAWNKLYKKSLFDYDVEFKKGVWFEDVEFIYRLLPYVKNIGVVDGYFYQYVQRKGSITSSTDKRLYHYIDNWNGIIDYYKKHNLYEEYIEQLEYSYVRYIYATFVKQATKWEKSDYLEAVDTAIKNVKSNFPEYRKNKYFTKSLKGIYLILFSKPLANILYTIMHKKTLNDDFKF